MGTHHSSDYIKSSKPLSIITLNYSGILLSPFEFFSQDTQNKEMQHVEKELNEIFKTLLAQQQKGFNPTNPAESKFKWELGKIDQLMQQERYTPLYNKNAGIANGKLMTDQQFCEEWDKVFKKNAGNIKNLKYEENQRENARKFDLLCYRTIKQFICRSLQKKKKETTDESKVKEYSAFLSYMFSKSFLNQDKKLHKTFQALEKEGIDICFAQEANQRLIEQLKKYKQYRVFANSACESIIICKKDKFSNFYEEASSPLEYLPIKTDLQWNNDTVVAFVDNLILISGHLSSKKDKNPKQVFDMIQSLNQLSNIYPMCTIIVGCDANSYVPETYKKYVEELSQQPQSTKEHLSAFLPKKAKIYPASQKDYTTSKTRTYLQPQINKAQVNAQVCRDHLIIYGSNMQLQKQQVCTILNQNPKDVPTLPCEEHPYDHYVVKADILVNVISQVK